MKDQAQASEARDLYRAVMGSFPTGVTVMTVCGPDGRRHGVTASSFNTVSLDPPLILWSLGLRAPSLAAFRAADHFVVNILEQSQRDLALHFARPAEDKFLGIAHDTGASGAPRLAGALAQIECRITARHPGGDHEIILGEVTAMSHREGTPLVFHRSGFCRPVALAS